jgi:GNAT superfamily N-acetyltransferase
MPAMERMMAGRGEAGAHRVVAARRPGGGAAEFVPLSAETRLEAWDEAARFLAAGFDRPFSTAALRWEFRHGFLLTARRSGALVGTQGFIPLALGIGDRIVQSAKSERTLLIPAERGTGLFEALYERAVALAADRLGAALLWGLTAVPQAFEKIGYSIFSDVYTHSMIPIGRADAPAAEWKAALLSLAGLAMRPLVTLRLRSPVLFPRGGRGDRGRGPSGAHRRPPGVVQGQPGRPERRPSRRRERGRSSSRSTPAASRGYGFSRPRRLPVRRGFSARSCPI